MMSRKKGPALYELISSKQGLLTSRPTSTTPPYSEDESLDHNVLTPGRSVRMSIGTIGVVAAIGIALMVVSYAMGVRKGSAVAKEDYGNRLFEELPAATFTEVDSVASEVDSPNTELESPSGQVLLSQNEQTASSTSDSWGPVKSDPRVLGSYYYSLIQTTEGGAMQLAAFCRERGLETYVISGNNTPFHRVIAFPGLAAGNSIQGEELLSQIHAIGQEWAKTSAGRGSDLQDAYPSLYK